MDSFSFGKSEFKINPSRISYTNMNKETPFYVFLFGVFLIVISPAFLTHGMFMDGMIYASVSKNLSEGLGTIWQPHFTETCYPNFFEHPPLAFGLQSLFFKIFGSGFYVEKLYSVFMWILVAVGLIKISRLTEIKKLWLPVFVLLTITRVFWASTNNMLENTVAVFLIFALFFYLKSLTGAWYFKVISGIFIAAGFLTKGPFALFIWGFPFLYHVLFLKQGILKSIRSSLYIVLLTLLPLAILLFFSDAAFLNLKTYFEIQVVNSLKNIETVESRWFIIKYMFSELIIPMILLLFAFVSFKRSKSTQFLDSKILILSFVFILTGLAGVLPIMISMKQSGFYILPAFPFFALGFALLIQDQFSKWIQSIQDNPMGIKIFSTIAGLVLILGVTLNVKNFGEIGRDEAKIADMHQIVNAIDGSKKVRIALDLRYDWSLHAYYQRYYSIALDPNFGAESRFLISKNASEAPDSLFEYKRIPLNTREFHLHKISFSPKKEQQ